MTVPKARTSNILLQETGDELLIYDLPSDKAFCLNQPAALVFQFCSGDRTVEEIADLVSQRLDVSIDEDFVRLTVNEIARNGLLDKSSGGPSFMSRQTRRDMLKRSGLTLSVALPVISSIAVPGPASAQSTGLTFLVQCVPGMAPFCGAGLTCSQCITGSCNNINVCCISGGLIGPGGTTGLCVDTATCSGSQGQCCSGTASPSGVFCGTPGNSDCVCK